MTTYIELANYFLTIPGLISGVKQVTVGADEEELSLQSNTIRYPHLRIDTPDIEYLNDNESPVTRYKFKLAMLANVAVQTYPNENQALSDMEALLRQVYNKIVHDAENTDDFDLVLGKRGSSPIRRWSGDNAFGWLMDITIDLYTATC